MASLSGVGGSSTQARANEQTPRSRNGKAYPYTLSASIEGAEDAWGCGVEEREGDTGAVGHVAWASVRSERLVQFWALLMTPTAPNTSVLGIPSSSRQLID